MLVSADVLEGDRKGDLYQARHNTATRFCVVYQEHWVSRPKSMLTVEHKARPPRNPNDDLDDFVQVSEPVLDRLYQIQERDGRAVWTAVRTCPPSPKIRNFPLNPQ